MMHNTTNLQWTSERNVDDELTPENHAIGQGHHDLTLAHSSDSVDIIRSNSTDAYLNRTQNDHDYDAILDKTNELQSPYHSSRASSQISKDFEDHPNSPNHPNDDLASLDRFYSIHPLAKSTDAISSETAQFDVAGPAAISEALPASQLDRIEDPEGNLINHSLLQPDPSENKGHDLFQCALSSKSKFATKRNLSPLSLREVPCLFSRPYFGHASPPNSRQMGKSCDNEDGKKSESSFVPSPLNGSRLILGSLATVSSEVGSSKNGAPSQSQYKLQVLQLIDPWTLRITSKTVATPYREHELRTLRRPLILLAVCWQDRLFFFFDTICFFPERSFV
jgi:hypothetical protein